MLNRRGPRPPGHTFLKPEKHETFGIYINVKWGAAWDFLFLFFLNIIAANSNDVWNENSLSSLQRRFCCVQGMEAEMHNFRLGETARKTYHTQQDLKDFQTGTPGAWSFLSFLTVFNAQAPRLTSLCSQLAGACTKKFCFMQNTQSWKESPEDLYRYLEGKH